jgi:hypothetical protein
MRKLKLQVDDLRVDTFDTMSIQSAEGTVFGEQCTCNTQCTCPGLATCYHSCVACPGSSLYDPWCSREYTVCPQEQ